MVLVTFMKLCSLNGGVDIHSSFQLISSQQCFVTLADVELIIWMFRKGYFRHRGTSFLPSRELPIRFIISPSYSLRMLMFFTSTNIMFTYF